MGEYTYRLTPTEVGCYAKCQEMDVAAEGRCEADAVERLREAIEEKLAEPNAVGAPSRSPSTHVVLRPAPEKTEPSPQGPGEALPPDEAGHTS